MAFIEMDDQHGPTTPIDIAYALDAHFVTAALYTFTYEDTIGWSDAQLRETVIQNIAFEGSGALMTAAYELRTAEREGRLSPENGTWLRRCRANVMRIFEFADTGRLSGSASPLRAA
ncbi:hypothetical protein P8605_14280 [Streptomyces sp. T-3]|nr:hypothetical protein [Streptomyces sp. T-3]